MIKLDAVERTNLQYTLWVNYLVIYLLVMLLSGKTSGVVADRLYLLSYKLYMYHLAVQV